MKRFTLNITLMILLFTVQTGFAQLSGSIGGSKITTVGNIKGALQQCLYDSGYVKSTVLTDIVDLLDCSNKNLINSDIDQILNIPNLTGLNISNNLSLTNVSALGKLRQLISLDLSNNTNLVLPDFSDFSALQELYLNGLGLSSAPNLSQNNTLVKIELKNNQITAGLDTLPQSLQELDVTQGLGGNSSYCELNPSSVSSISVDANNLNLADCSAIQGLSSINVTGGNFPNTTQDISSFIGDSRLFALTIDSTNLKQLDGTVPVCAVFGLKNNSELKYVEPLRNAQGDVIPVTDYITLIDDDNENLLCSNRFEWAEPISVLKNSTESKKAPVVEECPQLGLMNQYKIPDTCRPDPVQSFNVYSDTNTQRRFLTWTKDPNHDYNQWGVSSYELKGYDSAGNVIMQRQLPLDVAQPFVTNDLDPTKYTISACTADKCGYETTVIEANFEQGLSRVTDLQTNWLDLQNNSKDFKFAFNYPKGLPIGISWSGFLSYLDVTSNSISKTGGSNTNDYGATSIQEINGNGYVEFKNINENNQSSIAGLTDCNQTTCQLTQNTSFMNYGIQMSGGKMRVYERINNALTLRQLNNGAYYLTYNTTDTFRVAVIDGVVNYFKNSELIYTSGVPPQFPLTVGAALHSEGDYLSNFSFVSTDPNNQIHSGEPTNFKIYADMPQANGEYLLETIPQTSGNNVDGWLSSTYNYNELIGNSFKVFACNDTLGCGEPAEISVSTPVTSDNLPIPQLSDPSSFVSDITLSWTLGGLTDNKCDISPLQGTSVLDRDCVDYIEVTEFQPVIHANQIHNGNSALPRALLSRLFYIDNIDGPITLKRQARGEYKYSLRACYRDRINGDVCSSGPVNQTTVNHNRNDVPFALFAPDNINAFLDNSNNKFEIQWQWQESNQALQYHPDYFYVTNTTSNSACGMEQFTINYADKITQNGAKTWTTKTKCDDLGNNTTWKVQACVNGLGCSQLSTAIIINNTSQPLPPPPAISSPVIGGPGDLLPGAWWHPALKGTGWHFYWASDLRNPSTQENYGKTYDLVGYWFAYRELNGIWTPVWFETRMKQVIPSSGNPLEGYFEGDIVYYEKTGSTFDKIDAGNIQLYFGSNKQHATLLIDPDYEGGIFSAISSADDMAPYNQDINLPSSTSFGKLALNIEDFSIDIIGGNPQVGFGAKNDFDHYSGLWQHFDANNNPDVSVLSWIERSLEFTTVATFDTAGVPIWLQATSCGSSCNRTDSNYFESYQGTPTSNIGVVKYGYNPLAAIPLEHDFGSTGGAHNITTVVGGFGRCYNKGTDNMRFRNGSFWMNINQNLTYPATATDTGSSYIRYFNSYGSDDNLGCNSPVEYALPLVKKASLHDIRFFVNGQDETVTSCDPNTEGECVVKFTWYTDDDFPSIEPYYSLDGGSTFTKLNDLCPGVPGGYVVTQFECTLPLFSSNADHYIFQLHKPKYVGTGTVAIAESQELTVQPCTTSQCTTALGDPADAPEPETYLDSISADPLSDLVGTTSGAFDIDESGSANYSIPIFAPKGRGGLAPQMALSYNSSAGNGIAGVGWNISGTSAITRCLKSKEQDTGLDNFPAVSMTTDDALCLDGQRLFKVDDGNGNITYRSEIDSFSKIIPHGTAGNGPSYFTVMTKNGEIREYGSNSALYKGSMFTDGTGAQIVSNDGVTVHTWLLNKIEDRATTVNNIYFIWDTKDGENYLSQVKWTNPASGKNHYQINFNYSDSRPDAMHHYGIGTEFKAYRYLKYISTFIRPTPSSLDTQMQEVRRIKLTYENQDAQGIAQGSEPSGMLRLGSIEQCLNEGTCLQPVNFEWDNNNTQINYDTASSSTHISKFKEMGYGSFKPVDINGDGKLELIFIRGYDDGNFILENLQTRYWVAYHNDGTQVLPTGCEVDTSRYYDHLCDTGISPFDAESQTADNFNSDKWFVLDYDGDGNQDILTPIYINGSQDTWNIILSDGVELKSSNEIDTGIAFYNRDAGSSLLDYTSDGLPDLMTFDKQTVDGNDVYKYKLFPMVNDGSGYYFTKDATRAKNINIDTDKLIPQDMICNNGVNGLDVPCVVDFIGTSIRGRILAKKLETVATDFNGDGYNDAIYTYSYRYGNDSCTNVFNPSNPNAPVTNIALPSGEYSTESTASSSLLNTPQIPYVCEQKFKAIMLFSKDNSGNISFKFAGRLGIIDLWTDGDIRNDDLVPVASCNESTVNECRGKINGRIGSSKVMDINGDGLGDHMYLNTINSYSYEINKGTSTSITIPEFGYGSSTFLNGFTYQQLDFTSTTRVTLPNIIGSCLTTDTNNADQDPCARRFLTQFLDYDLDGDIDILYPDEWSSADASGNIKYKLKTYQQLSDGSFAYQDHALASLVSYNKDNEPQAYINTFLDLNGDGNSDYLSIYRDVDPASSNNFIAIQTGNNTGTARNKITTITNKVDNKETHIVIDYTVATDADVYEKSTNSLQLMSVGNGSPVFDILSPMYLVSEVSKTAPGYADTIMIYNYAGLKVQGGGRGSLGFAAITSYDPYHDVTTVSEYYQDFPYIGMPKSTVSYYGDLTSSNLISESSSSYLSKQSQLDNGHITYFPYLYQSTEKEKAFNTDEMGVSTIGAYQKTILSEFTYSNNTYPAYGNLMNSEVRTCNGSATMSSCSLVESKVTVNAYSDDEANWLLSRLSNTSTTSTRTGSAVPIVRSSAFKYDAVTGQLIEEIINGTVNEYLRTVHDYDDYGQETATYQCSSHITSTEDCATLPTTVRSTDPTFIHRFKRTMYETDWNEFVLRTVEPFTTYTAFALGDPSPDEGSLTQAVTSQVITGTRNIYGSPGYVSDIFGTQTRTVYGVFGEAQGVASETGGKSTTQRRWCSQVSHCPTGASTVTIAQKLGSPTTRTYADVLGREIRKQTQMFDGDWSTIDTAYDQLGRTKSQSSPYSRGSTTTVAYYTTTKYDAMDRVYEIKTPNHCLEDGSIPVSNCSYVPVITTTSYDNLNVSVTNPNGQTTTKAYDVTGKVTSSTDANLVTVNYGYDANGNLTTTTSSGQTISMIYDNMGRKTSMTDPDKGSWSYAYNAMGEMIHQTDAKGQITDNYYDVRGRLYYRTQSGVQSVWEYDLNGNNGLLVNEYSGGQYVAGSPSSIAQIKNYVYDMSFHRPSLTNITVYDGEQLAPHYYTTSQTYDQYGRVYQSFDATGNGVLYQYNNYGYQNIIRDAADGELGQIYYEVKGTNARGQMTLEKYYNQFQTERNYEDATGFLQRIITRNNFLEEVQHLEFAFDKIGNLIRRTDENPETVGSNPIYTEQFEYDTLNRLKFESLFKNDIQQGSTHGYSYDATGNITFNGADEYLYEEKTGTNNAGPHAVTSAKGNAYFYDDNGNVTSKTGTNAATFSYTSFDKPDSIVSANGWTSELAYDAGRSRYIRKDYQNVTSKKVTHYLGAVEYIYENGTTTAKRYIGNLVINIQEDSINRLSWGFNYLLKDHIGSTHSIVNKQGNVITEMSFNAWGARRKSATLGASDVYQAYDTFTLWGLNDLSNDIEETTNRGFTGHEHFDQVGIIHMNGRIYDPSIGRFLQADPVIQDPYNTQSLNRYSYVMNNPLSYTDPTGYSRLRSGWWKVPLSIGAMFIPGVQNIATIFLRGALSGAILTGNLKGALKGGIQAAVTFGIAHGGSSGDGWVKASKSGGFNFGRSFAHALVGGISAEVDGGKFGHGFVSSYLSSGADYIGMKHGLGNMSVGFRVIANAIISGTISELTGGKFANGAMSAAFRVAFNHALEGEKRPHSHNGILYDNKGQPYPGKGYSYSPITGTWMKSDDAALTSVYGQETTIKPFGIGVSVGADGTLGFISGGISFSKVGSCVLKTECSGVGLGFSASISPSLNISPSEFDISPFVNLPSGTIIDTYWTLSGSMKVLGIGVEGEVSSGGEIGLPINSLGKGVGSSASIKRCEVTIVDC